MKQQFMMLWTYQINRNPAHARPKVLYQGFKPTCLLKHPKQRILTIKSLYYARKYFWIYIHCLLFWSVNNWEFIEKWQHYFSTFQAVRSIKKEKASFFGWKLEKCLNTNPQRQIYKYSFLNTCQNDEPHKTGEIAASKTHITCGKKNL